jgi:hypothetical protein
MKGTMKWATVKVINFEAMATIETACKVYKYDLLKEASVRAPETDDKPDEV